MRYRICDHVYTYTDSEENDIYRKFKYQFDNLFNADEIPINDTEFEEMYVHDDDFEKELNSFLQVYRNSMKFCVGYTGIGKTTSIRHCLELGVSNVTRLKTKSKCSQGKRMVVFPTFLDGARQHTADTFDLIGRVAAVCTSLEKEHPQLRDILRTSQGREQFYDFVREHTPRIVEPKKDFELVDLSYDDEIITRLSYAQDRHPYEYYANKLKYYIMLNNSVYDRLVIVLDDIETLPEQTQRDVIDDYLHFFGCMHNTDVQEDLEYRITMLISVRPHTLRLYRRTDFTEQYRELEAFSLATNAVITKGSIDLNVFFKKRFDYYTTRSSRVVGNKESWDECYESLMKLNNSFDGKYKSMIINLCFYNIRAALATYSKVFANRFWVQGNRTKEMFFTIDSQEYSFNNINVIRAIGCGNSPVFTGTENPAMPNIFLTSEHKDYSILCLLVMQYFRRAAFGDDGPMEITYGQNAEELCTVLERWTKAVGAKRTKQLYKALVYLFEQKVLRKSIEDSDDIRTLDKPESLESDSKLYISPRGYELLAMLSRDSVYLEMLRECSWREYDGRENAYSYLPSYELLIQKKQHLIFLDLLEYIDYLREQEESVFFDPNSDINLEAYRDAFGPSMIVMDLLQGVDNSLSYSGHKGNSEVYKKYLAVRDRIIESTGRLQEGI